MPPPPFDPEDTFVFRRPAYDDEQRGPFPEDLRAWQPAVRLVKLVQQITADLPPEAADNPAKRALAGVLLWCLATGRYGSWEIETLCAEEPLCHHLAAGFSPSHADIHRYRRDQEEVIQAAFVRLLRVCWPASLNLPEPDFAAEAARRYARARLADTMPPD